MIVLIGIQGDTNDYRVEKCWFWCRAAFRSEIVTDVELELIGPCEHGLTSKERMLRATICIRYSGRTQRPVAVQRVQANIDASCRSSGRRVEDVRRKLSHRAPFADHYTFLC